MFYNYPKKSSFGGGKEVWTPDPLLAKQVLSQLSYTPVYIFRLFRIYSRPLLLMYQLYTTSSRPEYIQKIQKMVLNNP